METKEIEKVNICKSCVYFDGLHCIVSFENFPNREKCFYFSDGKSICPVCSGKEFIWSNGNFVCKNCGYTRICEESEF